MIVGCYSVDLYCDAADWDKAPHAFDEFPHQFTGETYGQCARQARKRGWRLTRDFRAICPKCNRRREQTKSDVRRPTVGKASDVPAPFSGPRS